MRRKCLLLTLLAYCLALHAGEPMLKLINTSFSSGESLLYQAYFQWGSVYVDQVIIETKVSDDVYEGTPVYDILAVARTEKTMRRFYALLDTFEVKMRKADMASVWFYQQDYEKNYHGEKRYRYHYTDSTATIDAYEDRNGDIYQDRTTFAWQYPMDAFCLLFRLRNYDFSEAMPGNRYKFEFFNKGKCEVLHIVYVGPDAVTLRNGTSYPDCNKFIFETSEGTLFSKDNPVSIWVTRDRYHQIVHAEAKLKIGTAKIDLTSVKR
ncbi:MAG: DUF3108 domain-containing protein [Paludibacteraceae bacterium]|nr:DUF3108 domain-containing protein [Paludibacteraceae bacterium]